MSTTMLPPQLRGAPSVLAEAKRVVVELREVLWAARDSAEKLETVAAIEELKSVLDSVELDVVCDLEATHGASAVGWASTRDFVTAVAGGDKGTGPRTLRLADA